MRHGPLHGYRLKQLIAERVSDFAQIKLPAIYYHLEKMQNKNLVSSETEQEGKRPERSVYSITDEGKAEFKKMLSDALKGEYSQEFLIDAVIFFMEYSEPEKVLTELEEKSSALKHSREELQKHRKDVKSSVPEEFQDIVDIIFSHHQYHLEAENKWAEKAISLLKKNR